MANFVLYIDTENDAFSDNAPAEVSRILRELADKLESEGELNWAYSNLHDINGNIVGKYAHKHQIRIESK